MRKHHHQLLLRLNDAEYKKLISGANKTGLTVSAYIRQLISGYLPKESPPVAYYSMMKQLYQVGNNLNQIAKKAHVLQVMDVQKYDEAVKCYEQIIKEITKAVILPRKIE